MISKTAIWIERLFNEHQFMRRFSLFWAMFLITDFGYILLHRGEFTEKMYLAMVGLFASAIGLYIWKKVPVKRGR